MALHRVTADSLVPVDKVGLAQAGLREREDIQRLLKESVEIVSPDTLVYQGRGDESIRELICSINDVDVLQEKLPPSGRLQAPKVPRRRTQ